MIRLLLILTIVILQTSWTKLPDNHDIDTCHCSSCMNIKIGQMIIAGFKGVEPSDEIIKAIREYNIGGVIYFDADVSRNFGERNVRSPQQLRALSESLQKLSPIYPLFISIDQEGGLVNRLKPKYGFPGSVSAANMGAVDDLDYTRAKTAEMAKTVAESGINLNFAPCVDLSINPENPIIAGKERAFARDPQTVITHARIFVEELHKKKVLTSLKHFPGHGSSHTDSHLGLVYITSCWSESELEPYRSMISEEYSDFVMVGHLINRNIDTLPASLSKKMITDLLCNELGFNGIVVTDDMNMGAIVQNYSLERALSLSINAGVNMIIVGNNGKLYEEDLAIMVHGIIKRLVESGEIPVELIDKSFRKIVKQKSRL